MNARLLIATAALSVSLCGAAFAAKIGDVAPDFTRTDFSGKQVRPSDYRGKLVLLNFWATWCAPCREEMPAFSKWQRDWSAQGLQVIGVSMDDDAASVKEFLATHAVAYPIVMGDAKLAADFGGVLGLPLSYLIDTRGRIIARYQGEAQLALMEHEIKGRLLQSRK